MGCMFIGGMGRRNQDWLGGDIIDRTGLKDGTINGMIL